MVIAAAFVDTQQLGRLDVPAGACQSPVDCLDSEETKDLGVGKRAALRAGHRDDEVRDGPCVTAPVLEVLDPRVDAEFRVCQSVLRVHGGVVFVVKPDARLLGRRESRGHVGGVLVELVAGEVGVVVDGVVDGGVVAGVELEERALLLVEGTLVTVHSSHGESQGVREARVEGVGNEASMRGCRRDRRLLNPIAAAEHVGPSKTAAAGGWNTEPAQRQAA
jgi:hypothetical protein